MTNDGELAHALMHPRFHVPKTYRAVVDGIPDEGDLGRLRAGIELDDGRTAPAEAHVAGSEPGSTTVLLTLREGRKRQVRRMFSAIGHPVTALARVAYGPLTDEGLAVGGVRELAPDEVEALRASVGGGD
jgi:23S rRNA pseudouridine2605 synthase